MDLFNDIFEYCMDYKIVTSTINNLVVHYKSIYNEFRVNIDKKNITITVPLKYFKNSSYTTSFDNYYSAKEYLEEYLDYYNNDSIEEDIYDLVDSPINNKVVDPVFSDINDSVFDSQVDYMMDNEVIMQEQSFF